MEVKLDVLGREVIKPSSSSPRDRLQLSTLDFSCPAIYVSTVFFYKAEDLVTVSPEITSGNLKSSLSQTLSRFYPLAGRIEGTSISCNDEGAVFTEARTDLLLPDFLRNVNTDSLENFLPKIAPGDSPAEWPLLSVKVTFFGSRSGVAVSVSVSHKICDAASLLTLVKDWSATTAKEKSKDVTVSTHEFAETTIYPPPHISLQSPSTDTNFNVTRKCAIKRLVFESSKIVELRRKAASESVPLPTRVEAIMSLIWRCVINSSRSNSVVPRLMLMIQAMDLRLRIPSTVLSRDAIGNLQGAFFLKNKIESDLEISANVAAFRKAKEGIEDMIKENLQGNNNTLGQNLLSVMGSSMSELSDIDIYLMSSWCKKPFYEVDFGWGCPVWMGSASHDNIVYALLIDSKDGAGVEAWISLPEQDMSVFVGDQELLAYAVLNPPVHI